MADHDNEAQIKVAVLYRKQRHEFSKPRRATFHELATEMERATNVPLAGQKYILKGAVLRPAGAQLDRRLSEYDGLTLQLIGTEASQLNAFQKAEHQANVRKATAARPSAKARKTFDPLAGKYTFHNVVPLPNLPDPARSKALLERLRDDVGIRAAMRKYKLEVGTLTEMEPLSNTQSTHEGTTRLLGLNRNQGQAIELRLWTDAYDGFRDYNTIRKTLCHELAHNRHGPHDRQFWDFCHQIERDVHEASTGHQVSSGSSAYVPSREEDVDDHGGWTGGEFVLGSGTSRIDTRNLSTREILARAAEERRRRMNDDDPNGGNQGSSQGP